MMKLLDYTEITGSFGPLTQQAVEQVQSDSGLVVDGVADHKPGSLFRPTQVPSDWLWVPTEPPSPHCSKA